MLKVFSKSLRYAKLRKLVNISHLKKHNNSEFIAKLYNSLKNFKLSKIAQSGLFVRFVAKKNHKCKFTFYE